MNWIGQYWVLILLGVIVLLVALWWLLGSSKRIESSAQATPLERRDDVSPIITAPNAAPLDIPAVVELTPVLPEPEALVEPIHPIPAGPPDELTRMKGVGPKVAALLNGLGVTRYDQIAAWSDADVARLEKIAALGTELARDRHDPALPVRIAEAKGDAAPVLVAAAQALHQRASAAAAKDDIETARHAAARASAILSWHTAVAIHNANAQLAIEAVIVKLSQLPPSGLS